jgi:photosystem II stability/assembly factor-like uncharacterized protein
LVCDDQGNTYASVWQRGVYRSSDNGATWQQKNTGLTDLTVGEQVIDKVGHIYVGTESGMFRSTNEGELWEKTLSGYISRHAQMDSSGAIIALSPDRLYRSTDHGANWSEIAIPVSPPPSPPYFAGFAVHPDGDYVWSNPNDASIFRSSDNGSSWIDISPPVVWSGYGMTYTFNSVGHIFYFREGDAAGVQRSTNKGGEWEIVNGGLTTTRVIMGIRHPSGHIFLATNGSGVFRTTHTTEPPPVISSVHSIKGKIGETVTISGTNFGASASSNIVYFGAVRASVVGANPSTLSVTVPPGATYAPITVTVNHHTAYSAAPFMPSFGSDGGMDTSSFEPKVAILTDILLRRGTVADLDGDGKPDLVAANNTNNVSVFRNTSTPGSIDASSFAPRVDFAVGNRPYQVTAGDLDGDGRLDLVAANNSSNNISVLRNTGSPGNLSFDRQDFGMVGAPQGVAIGDLDGDGRPDVVATNQRVQGLSPFSET